MRKYNVSDERKYVKGIILIQGYHLKCLGISYNSIAKIQIIQLKKKKNQQEFPLWHSRNESDWEPLGGRFDPWPCSVG